MALNYEAMQRQIIRNEMKKRIKQIENGIDANDKYNAYLHTRGWLSGLMWARAITDAEYDEYGEKAFNAYMN